MSDDSAQQVKPAENAAKPIPAAALSAGPSEQPDGSAKISQSDSRDAESPRATRPEGNADSMKAQSEGQPTKSAAKKEEQHAQQLSTDGPKQPPKAGAKKRISAAGIVGILLLLGVALGVFAYMQRKKKAKQQVERSDQPLA